MKLLVVLLVCGIIAALGINWYMDYQVYEDERPLVAYACGNPRNGQLDIQIAVSFGMTRLDSSVVDREDPRMKDKPADWDTWVGFHFELRDESGSIIPLKRAHFANLIPEAKIGTPDFYAAGKVEPNMTYTLDYYPTGKVASEPYRDTFTTTDQGKPFRRARFEPLEG